MNTFIDRPRYSTDPIDPAHKGWNKGVRWSAGAHLAVILTVVIKSLVFPGNPIPFIPVLRVDIVGLPDQLKKDLATGSKSSSLSEIQKALDKAEADIKRSKIKAKAQNDLALKNIKEMAKADPDEMVVKPHPIAGDRQKKLKSALARIKSLNKISTEEEADTPSPGPAGKNIPIKGNMISKGNSLSGDARESAQSTYYDALRAQLVDYWTLPVWLQRQKLSAQVLIAIDGKGRLRQFRFVKLSGNAQFDSLVKRTLNDAQPLPIPPPELAQLLLVDGLLIGFPL